MAALSAAELATIEIVACRSVRRACLAGELVSGFLDGLAQRDVAGELADLSPDGTGAVVTGHPGDGDTANLSTERAWVSAPPNLSPRDLVAAATMTLSSVFVVWDSLRLRRFVPFN
jgi:hypothetical protein